MGKYDDDDTAFDLQHDMKLERQLEREADMKHEARLHSDLDYALEQLGLPEIMHMLEHLSSRLDGYGHSCCVKMLINKLEDY